MSLTSVLWSTWRGGTLSVTHVGVEHVGVELSTRTPLKRRFDVPTRTSLLLLSSRSVHIEQAVLRCRRARSVTPQRTAPRQHRGT